MVRGGIRLVDESTLILPSNAQLYNNHADKAGDDIYLGNNSVINFGPTGAGWQLDGTPNTNDCLKNIDGWYDDSENNRWNAHSMEKLHVKKVNNGEYNNSIALKAAHGIQVEDVYNEGAPSFVKMDAVTRIPVKGAEFTLYKDDVVIKTAISNEKGEFSFGKLPIGKYLMKETKTPDGYAIMTEELNIEVYEDTSNINEKLEIKDGEVVNVINHGVKVKFAGSEDFFTALENGIVTVLNNATINVEFHKEWNDKGYDIKHPEEIKAMVKSNGVDFKEITISEADNWATVVKDLPKYTKDGKEVIYTVEETTKLPEYNVTYSKDGKTIINTYKTTDVEFHKEWNDKGNDVKHPEEIKAMIKSNGVDFKEITISEADNWSTVVKDLPKVDKEGKEIVYTVEEITKLKNYVASYSEDGLTITNTYNKKEQPEVPDIQKPENNHPDNSDKIVPNTGDESGLALYGLLFMAMLVLIGALEVGRKRELRRK